MYIEVQLKKDVTDAEQAQTIADLIHSKLESVPDVTEKYFLAEFSEILPTE